MDYKEKYQAKAEQIALDRHGVEFYDLPEEAQHAVYEEAIESVRDQLVQAADLARE